VAADPLGTGVVASLEPLLRCAQSTEGQSGSGSSGRLRIISFWHFDDIASYLARSGEHQADPAGRSCCGMPASAARTRGDRTITIKTAGRSR